MGSPKNAATRVGPAHPVDRRLELGDEVVGELLLATSGTEAVVIRRREVVDPVVEVVEPGDPVARLATDGDRGERGAVVGVDPAQDPPLLGSPECMLVELHEPECGVDRRRATAREEHMVQVAGSEFGEAGGELHRRHVGHVDERVRVREIAHLGGDRVGHLVAPEPDVRAPHAADRVEILPPVVVDEPGARPTRDRQHVVGPEGVEALIRVEQVTAVELDDRAGIEIGHAPTLRSGRLR